MQRVVFARMTEVLDRNVDPEGLSTVTPALRRTVYTNINEVPDDLVLPELRVHSGTSGLVWSLAAAAQAEDVIAFYDGVVGRVSTAHCMEMRLPARGPRGDEFTLFYSDGSVRGSIGSILPHGDQETATLVAELVIFNGHLRMALRASADLAIGATLTLPHYGPKPEREILQDGDQLPLEAGSRKQSNSSLNTMIPLHTISYSLLLVLYWLFTGCGNMMFEHISLVFAYLSHLFCHLTNESKSKERKSMVHFFNSYSLFSVFFHIFSLTTFHVYPVYNQFICLSLSGSFTPSMGQSENMPSLFFTLETSHSPIGC